MGQFVAPIQYRKAINRSLLNYSSGAPSLHHRGAGALDILALNLTRAVQICIDIGAHLVSETNYSPPDIMGQTFDVLNQAGIISTELADRMKKVVGFRNIAVHNHDAIHWAIVHSIATQRLPDFAQFAKAVVRSRKT